MTQTSSSPRHYDRSSKRYWFRQIPEHSVALERVGLATRMLLFVVNELSIGEIKPMIVWISPEDCQIAANEHYEATVHRAESSQPFSCKCRSFASDNFDGWTPRNSTTEIWIRADRQSPVLEWAVAHELRHLYQKKLYGDSYRDADREPDAYSYSREALRRYQSALRTESLDNA